MAIIIGLAAVIFTGLGGLFALKFKDKLHLILGFSAGAVISVALFELLPESINLGSGKYGVNKITSLVALGFVIFMIFDRLFSLHFHEEDKDEHSHGRGRLGAATLSFHSLLDGFCIGLAFKISSEIGWIVAAAVLAHDFSDGINTVNMVLKNSGGFKEAAKWLIVDAVAPAVGVLAAFFFTVNDSTLGLILAVFTGFFLYISASDLIPESHHRHPKFATTLMTILGMVVIFVATLLGK
jgi:ZIP family zinc transporter